MPPFSRSSQPLTAIINQTRKTRYLKKYRGHLSEVYNNPLSMYRPLIDFLVLEIPRVMGYAFVRNYHGHLSTCSHFLKKPQLKVPQALSLSGPFAIVNPKRF